MNEYKESESEKVQTLVGGAIRHGSKSAVEIAVAMLYKAIPYNSARKSNINFLFVSNNFDRIESEIREHEEAAIRLRRSLTWARDKLDELQSVEK